MRTPGMRRFPTTVFALAAGVSLLAVTILIGVAPAASAAGTTINQVAPLQGVTLAGQAFNAQLQVAGANGVVTFAQTTGSDVTVTSSGAVSAPAGLSNGAHSASGTDSDTSGNTGTWSFTLSVVPPAPAGFGDTIVSVYQSIYNVGQRVGQASALQNVTQYQQQVSQLSPEQLAAFYNAAQQNPEWYQIPSLMQTVASGLPGTASAPTTTAPAPSAAPAATAKPAASPVAPSSSSSSSSNKAPTKAPTSAAGAAPAAAGATQPPVVSFAPAMCPPLPPDSEIFALQITIDALQGVYNGLMAAGLATSIIKFADIGLGIAAGVDAIALLGVTIAHDVLADQVTVGTLCRNDNVLGYVANLDNTTTQTYALLTSVAATVSQLQSTDGQTQTDVVNLASQMTNFQTTLNQTIATDIQQIQAQIQTTVGGDTQGVTSQLQTNLTAIQQDLASIKSSESTLSQLVTTQTNASTTAIQSSVSAAVSQLLSQINSDAQGITNLVTQGNQQVMTTLQSNFATQQSEFQSDLTLQIEDALSEWGNIVPQVQMMLPASQGGFLNSTPVGVQSVVTNDMKALNAMGVKITSSATASFNAANAALAAGKYMLAFQDYAACYQAIA